MVHEHRKRRELKDPILRKQEILDQAMILFTCQGYENTSMRDIAKSLNISLGLCYRYFDSKQILFQDAMDQYVKKCSNLFIHIFETSTKEFPEKIEDLFQIVVSEDTIFPYHQFFHLPQNKGLHDQLSIKICENITPYMIQEIKAYCQKHQYQIKNIDILVRFLTYGQIGLLSDSQMPNKEMIQLIQHYIDVLIKSEIVPD